MKILLLEDNTTDADLTKRGLTDSIPDCNIDIAPTMKLAREALALEEQYDITLLDMKLPDGNGLDLLLEIRQKNLDMAVIILTGSGDEEVAVTALKSGANDYVVKRRGYIEKLPEIIDFSIQNYKQSVSQKAEIINVLYIEHHSADIDLTIRHLKQYAPNIRIDAIKNPEEALLKLENKKEGTVNYDVILLDYQLPGTNALELIKRIRQEKKISIPILLVTGHGNEEIAVQVLKLGANDYMTKSEKYLFRLPSLIVNTYQKSKLQKQQAALKESESRYRLLAENSGDAIFILNMDWNWTYISPAIKALRGFEVDEAMNQDITEALTSESNIVAENTINELLKSESDEKSGVQTILIELEMIRKDLSTVWTEVKASLIRDDKGNTTGILGVARDISKRKKITDELIIAKNRAEESDMLKTAFLHNISHEIRTPLNAIVGFSTFLNNPQLTTEKRQKYSNIIVKSSTQLLSIISDIINIATIEAGQEELSEELVNLNSICHLLKDQYITKANENSISYLSKLQFSDKEALVKTDQTKLLQILTNLLDNAFKFTNEGNIEFGYTVKEKYIEFYVKDTGIGIPTDKFDEIFNRFQQVENTATRNYGGSGLGLTLSKAYVELFGGKIWLDSELDKGSVFYFTIPYKKDQQIISQPEASTEEFFIETKNSKTLLVAEDEEFNYELVVELLADLNINIIRATNGKEAVEICRSNPNIDLVLMDIKMPVMNGCEATKKIKEFLPDLPIIAQTAYSTDADKDQALACGCTDFLCKPFKREMLLAKINAQMPK